MAVLVALIPLVVFAERAWSRGAYPVFDDAIIALRIHDVFSSHPPLLGAGTKFGRIALEADANHPGPLPFYLLAPVYALSGYRAGGVVLSLLLYHAAFVVGIAALARRLGGDRLLILSMAGVLLLERSFGGDVFTRTFNPYLGQLPFFAMLLACWAAMARSPWYLAAAVFAGSVAAQAQVAFVAPVAVLLVTTAALVVVRGGVDRRVLRAGVVAAGVGLLCWAPALWQELTTEHGNLARLWDALRRPVPSLGPRDGSAIVWQILGHVPPRLAGLGPPIFSRWLDPDLRPAHVVRAAGVVAGLVALLVTARRRKAERATAGVGLALAAVAVTAAFVPSISADAFSETYQFLWVWVVNAFVLVAVSWAILELVSPHPIRLGPTSHRAPVVLVGAALAVLAVLAALAIPPTTPQLALIEDEHRPSIRATRDALGGDDQAPYLVSCVGSSLLDYCASLVLALEVDGVPTRQDPRATFLYGPDQDWRKAGPNEVLPNLVVYRGADVVAPVPGARLLSEPDRTAAEAADERLAIDALEDEPVVVTPEDVAALTTARFELFAPRLVLKTGTTWFRGTTAAEWNRLIRSDTERFVQGGGVPVLAAAGLLAGRPTLAAVAERWKSRAGRDAVWLTPPAAPGDRFPRRPA